MKFPSTLASALLALACMPGCGAQDDPASRVPFPPNAKGLNAEVLSRFQEAREALLEDLGSAEAWMHLGMTYEAHSYLQLALDCYGQAAARSDDPRTPFRSSITRASLGDLQGAVEAMQRSLALEPEYAPSHLQLGNFYFDQGRFDEAHEAYERGRSLDPTHLGGALGMARVALQRSQPEEAIELLQANLARSPKEPNTRRLLHTAYLHAGQVEEAEALSVRWHSFISPGADPWAQEFAAYAAPPVMELARAEITNRNGARAVELLEPFVKANPNETNGLAHLAWAYHLEGRTSQGLALADESLERFPKDLLLLGIKARIMEAQSRFMIALDLTSEILEIDPDNLSALEQRARLFAAIKKPKRTITAYQRILKLDRSRMEIWLGLGEAQLMAKQWKPASESFRQALELKPGAEAPFVGAMHAKWKLGDLKTAHKRLKKRKDLGVEGRVLLKQMEAELTKESEQ